MQCISWELGTAATNTFNSQARHTYMHVPASGFHMFNGALNFVPAHGES